MAKSLQKLQVKISSLTEWEIKTIKEINRVFKTDSITQGEYMLFNVTSVEVKEQSTVVPEGSYAAFVDKAEVKKTKDGEGQYLALMWKIAGPTHKNRTIFANYNFQNKNAKAQEIAMQDLKSILTAAGKTNFAISSPNEMLGLVCQIFVKTKVDSYGEKNIITNYSASKMDVAAMATTITQNGKSSTSARVPGL